MEPPALGPSAPSTAQRQPSAAWLAAFVLPPWFAKTSATQALQHSNRLVKYTALTVLDACFSKLAAIAARFDANAAEMSAAAHVDSKSASDEDDGDFDPARLLRDLLQELRRRLPDLQLLVALLSSLRPTLSVAEEEASPMLLYQRLLAVLAGYQRFLPDVRARPLLPASALLLWLTPRG